jgi:hypothetical protein
MASELECNVSYLIHNVSALGNSIPVRDSTTFLVCFSKLFQIQRFEVEKN